MSLKDPRGGGSRYLYEPFGGEGGRREMDEYLDILRSIGPPDQVRRRLEAIDELIEERKRRRWLFTSIKQVAGWATVVTAGWLAVRGLMAELMLGAGR